ncbi:hypothetical protein RRU01S_15_01040 [Agrobacterium rubi TR3 = NBRC 13261]|uniref:Helix-turn-helix domain-containing protein n=1 Tax=Agrobacterium rubi TR3 = NBRC 13261 TaxID=1368415 RepID=A0A081CWY3_9HYPH|nr:hypothetical protein [Agrobacterium rubi]MBP1878146.1 phage terminase Nu1 subunit (DNA packaging protein) [Agrobacterium rubi]GAK71179.1 hypothetical protein RRU01S_15_01040 [Agrobacterium rubi TR3 = NBRC 13261]
MNDINEIEVSARQLAEMLGVSDRRVRQLADQGVVVRGGKTGRYLLSASVKGYVSETKAASTDEAGQLLIAMRKQKLDREKLKSRISDGELIEVGAFDLHAIGVRRALEKSSQVLDRALMPVLKNASAVNTVVNAYHDALQSWLDAAETVIKRGADQQDLNEFFGGQATPSEARKAARRKPRKSEASVDE